MSQAGPSSLGYHRLSVENVPLRSETAVTWRDCVDTWESYLEDKADKRLFFLGDGEENRNEFLTVPYSHRFQQEYTRMQYAKIQDFNRGALSEYADPHIAFLTFSTSTLEPNGKPRPPLDHLDELLDTWRSGVYYELNQVMEGARKGDPWGGRDWEYLFILEPTTDEGRVAGGYAHAHVAIVADGELEPARFESVVSRHLTEAPNARGEAHEFDDAIEVKRAGELDNPGAYMFKYLGKSWDVDEMADYEKRFAALLFDQGRRRFRPSDGAQRWMRRDVDESESGEWIFAGVGTAEQARALAKYEDYDELRIETGAGVRTWLNRRSAVDKGAHYRTPDPEASASWEQPPAGPPPYKLEGLPTAPSVSVDGDRPPPNHGGSG